MLMNVRLLIELSRGSFAMAVSTWTLEAWPWWQTMHRLLASARGFPTPEGKTTLSSAAPAGRRGGRAGPPPPLRRAGEVGVARPRPFRERLDVLGTRGVVAVVRGRAVAGADHRGVHLELPVVVGHDVHAGPEDVERVIVEGPFLQPEPEGLADRR